MRYLYLAQYRDWLSDIQFIKTNKIIIQKYLIAECRDWSIRIKYSRKLCKKKIVYWDSTLWYFHICNGTLWSFYSHNQIISNQTNISCPLIISLANYNPLGRNNTWSSSLVDYSVFTLLTGCLYIILYIEMRLK